MNKEAESAKRSLRFSERYAKLTFQYAVNPSFLASLGFVSETWPCTTGKSERCDGSAGGTTCKISWAAAAGGTPETGRHSAEAPSFSTPYCCLS